MCFCRDFFCCRSSYEAITRGLEIIENSQVMELPLLLMMNNRIKLLRSFYKLLIRKQDFLKFSSQLV